eukprot:3298597-Heterocapsa_arctica.AAC.1
MDSASARAARAASGGALWRKLQSLASPLAALHVSMSCMFSLSLSQPAWKDACWMRTGSRWARTADGVDPWARPLPAALAWIAKDQGPSLRAA